MCVCMCVCVCIHIYIQRERERKRERVQYDCNSPTGGWLPSTGRLPGLRICGLYMMQSMCAGGGRGQLAEGALSGGRGRAGASC